MKFCKKCGTQMKDENEFCPKCGASQSADNTVEGSSYINETLSTEKRAAASTNSSISVPQSSNKFFYAGIAALLIVALCGGGYFYYNKAHVVNNPTTATTAEKNEGAEKTDAVQPPTESKTSEYDSIQKELNDKGAAGTVMASTKGHTNIGYVSLMKDGNNWRIVIHDLKNNRVGIIPYNRELFHFVDVKPTAGKDEVVIFKMTILNDAHDNDEKSGAWEGKNHVIPVYAQYKFDSIGNLKPGMLTTGRGDNPSHYQEYFYETRNVDTVNLFLTEMPSLKQMADEKKLNL